MAIFCISAEEEEEKKEEGEEREEKIGQSSNGIWKGNLSV